MKYYKNLFAFILIFSGIYTLNAQKVMIAKSSNISFFSKTPIRDIEAENTKTSSIINLETKEIAIKIPVKSFIFPNKLMQEHFNENYLESEKYPYSSFRGHINEIIEINKDRKYNVTATGKISLHGVDKDQTIKGIATIKDKKLTIESVFDISIADFKIDIPKIVFEEIAEKVKITFKINFEEKK